ncbi:unnamed protein product, partial [Rotaria sp. Silwood2]
MLNSFHGLVATRCHPLGQALYTTNMAAALSGLAFHRQCGRERSVDDQVESSRMLHPLLTTIIHQRPQNASINLNFSNVQPLNVGHQVSSNEKDSSSMHNNDEKPKDQSEKETVNPYPDNTLRQMESSVQHFITNASIISVNLTESDTIHQIIDTLFQNHSQVKQWYG